MEKLRASEVLEYHLVSLTQTVWISRPRQDLNPSDKPTKNPLRMDPHKKGQAPYGFRWQGGQLLSEEAESQTRRMAFELFLKLKSTTAAARMQSNVNGLVQAALAQFSERMPPGTIRIIIVYLDSPVELPVVGGFPRWTTNCPRTGDGPR